MVDSPPGRTIPSRSVEIGQPAHRPRRSAEIRQGAEVLAHVPLECQDADRHRRHRPVLPAAVSQALGQRADLLAPHGLAQAAAHLGHVLGVLEMRGRLHDRPGPAGRVLALEDARAHEHRFGARVA